METKTTGDRIAEEFSRDKVDLTDAEQRRLAGMIDAAVGIRNDVEAASRGMAEALYLIRARFSELNGNECRNGCGNCILCIVNKALESLDAGRRARLTAAAEAALK